MADNENTSEASVLSSAKATTTGGLFGGITGTLVGAAVSAAIGTLIGAVAGPVMNWANGSNPFTGVTPADAQAAQNASQILNGSATVTNGIIETGRDFVNNLTRGLGFDGRTVEVYTDPGTANEMVEVITRPNAQIPQTLLPTNTTIAPLVKGTPIQTAIGAGAGIGAAIGAVFGGITGTIGGMFTGWRNANPPKDGLEAEQAKQMEFAKGVAQGVTMAKIEDMELQAASTSWTERVGGIRKDPNMLFQDQIAQQKLALKTIEPMGTA